MNAFMNKTFPAVIPIFTLFFMVTGCAMPGLWRSYDDSRKVQIDASSDQLYFSCTDNGCEQQKLLIPFLLNNKNAPVDNAFPPSSEGYCVVSGKNCLPAVYAGLKTLMADPLLNEKAAIYLQLYKTVKKDQPEKYDLKAEIRAKLPEHFDFSRFDRQQESLRYSVQPESGFDDCHQVVQKGTTQFYLSKQSLKDSTHIDFIKTPVKERWEPVFTDNVRPDVNLHFVHKKIEKVYVKSAPERIILTPFAIAADIIMVPLMIITAPLWLEGVFE